MPDVLRQFLVQDCSSGAREKLLRAAASPSIPRGEFAFNRFNVTIDHQRDEVMICDDLDTGPDGELKLSIAEFTAALTGHG